MSDRHDTARSETLGEQRVRAAFAACEDELYGELAVLRGEDRLSDAFVGAAIANVAGTYADSLDDDDLWEVNGVLGVSFDERAPDPELLADDPDGCYLGQIAMAFGDVLRKHLTQFVADNPSLVAAANNEQRRGRLGPLAEGGAEAGWGRPMRTPPASPSVSEL